MERTNLVCCMNGSEATLIDTANWKTGRNDDQTADLSAVNFEFIVNGHDTKRSNYSAVTIQWHLLRKIIFYQSLIRLQIFIHFEEQNCMKVNMTWKDKQNTRIVVLSVTFIAIVSYRNSTFLFTLLKIWFCRKFSDIFICKNFVSLNFSIVRLV